MVNFSILEVSKIRQAKPFEIANLTKKAWLLVTDGCLPKCDFSQQSCIWTTRENKGQRNNITFLGKECYGQQVSISFKGKNDTILWWVIIVGKCVNYYRMSQYNFYISTPMFYLLNFSQLFHVLSG